MNKKLTTVIIITVIVLVSIFALLYTSGSLQNGHYDLQYVINGDNLEITNNQPFSVTVYMVFTNSSTGKTNTIQGGNLAPHQQIDGYIGTISPNTIDNVYGTKVNPNAPTPSPMVLGFLGNAEQASITNVVFNSNTQLTVTIQNTGSSNVTIVTASIDGNTATMNPLTLTVAQEKTGTVTLTSSTAFVNGAQYTINLTTAKGHTLSYTATCSGT